MDTVGIFALVAGIWVLYAGVIGVNPLTTFQKIIADPSNASKIIAETRANNAVKFQQSSGGDGRSGLDGLKGFEISRGFAQHKREGSVSPGIDFLLPVGTPVPAPVSGTLTFTANAGNYGNLATITRPNGDKIHLAHLSGFNQQMNNTQVNAGQFVGYSGGKKGAPGAGNSTGPHLHIDVQTGAGYVDPATYFTGGIL